MNKTIDLILGDFYTLSPEYSVEQKCLNDYMAWLMSASACAQNAIANKEEAKQIYKSIQRLIDEYAVSPNIIRKRNILPIAAMLKNANDDKSKITLPPLYENITTAPQGADIAARTQYFQQIIIDFLDNCYEKSTIIPKEIIHVTSMACIIPTPLQRFLSQKKWLSTMATNSYFVGCHGSVQALRLASGSLLNTLHTITKEKKSIDIIHTEFLSIHMDTLDLSPNNIISSTLFSDGFVKYSLFMDCPAQKHPKPGLKIIYLNEQLIPDSADAMRWEPGPYQFRLFLAKEIPTIISEHIVSFVKTFLHEVNMDWDKEKNNLVYAIHPGGSRILDIVKDKLELNEEQIRFSRELLFENGNISSATLPYLWKKIIESDEIKVGTKVLNITFGPGMTVGGILLEKI